MMPTLFRIMLYEQKHTDYYDMMTRPINRHMSCTVYRELLSFLYRTNVEPMAPQYVVILYKQTHRVSAGDPATDIGTGELPATTNTYDDG